MTLHEHGAINASLRQLLSSKLLTCNEGASLPEDGGSFSIGAEANDRLRGLADSKDSGIQTHRAANRAESKNAVISNSVISEPYQFC